jgi:hypothetical protein
MKKWLWGKWNKGRSVWLQKRQLLRMDERTRKDLAVSKLDAERLAGLYGPVDNYENQWRENNE